MFQSFWYRIKKSDGYAVAEFAITLPALLGVVGILFWTIGLGISKFKQENLTSNAARILARGEALPASYQSDEIAWTITEHNGRITVTSRVNKLVPIINKPIEVVASAETLSEIYELQE